MELAPKAQVLEGRGIYCRDILKIRVLEMVFPEVFTRYLFGQNKRKTGNNAVEMSQTYRTVRTFHRSKSVRICVQCHSKLGNGCLTILFDGAYFLLAVMVEGDESSRLKRAN